MSVWIPERDNKGNFYIRNAPFKSKEMDGKKLYKRVHGVVKNCSDALTEGVQTNHFEFVIPYDHAKLNMVQILWQPPGCTVELKVYDTPTGIYSNVPNAMLNQFGFAAGIAQENCVQHSEYDADMYKDMRLVVELTFPTGVAAQDICVNFGLNELK
jgi:hypothetical protein